MLKIIVILLFFPIVFPIWLLSKLFNISGSKSIHLYKYDKEAEMNRYGLEPWQKDLVRKGEYDSLLVVFSLNSKGSYIVLICIVILFLVVSNNSEINF